MAACVFICAKNSCLFLVLIAIKRRETAKNERAERGRRAEGGNAMAQDIAREREEEGRDRSLRKIVLHT